MIRQAREQDLPRIMAIYDAAQRYMRQTGNPTQWGGQLPAGADAAAGHRLRADTHADNLTMQRCLEREGFVRCGTIYVEDGTPRVAFERITQRRNDMDPIFEIELGECPICRGAGVMQDEQGWSVSVSCMDCGAETADAEYRTPEERLESARRVALLWNMGKVIHNGMSD